MRFIERIHGYDDSYAHKSKFDVEKTTKPRLQNMLVYSETFLS